MSKKTKRGFSLLEILIVIGIIMLLVGGMMIVVDPARRFAESRDAQREIHLDSILGAIEQKIFSERGRWDCDPIPTDRFTIIGHPDEEMYDLYTCISEYIPEMPVDPREGVMEDNFYDTRYAIWRNPATGNISLRTVSHELSEYPISAGAPGMGLEFDGEDDYIKTSFYPSEDIFGQTLTWSFWNNWYSFSSDTGSHGAGSSGSRLYVQLTSSGGRFRTAVGDDFWNSMTIPNTNEWYHIVIVLDEGTVYTYLDGSLEDTNEGVSFSGTSSEDFSLGRGFNEERYLHGETANHRIYDRALSEEEIEKLYKGEHLSDGLIGHWPLSDAQGCEAKDISGNENHGELKPDCPENSPRWTPTF